MTALADKAERTAAIARGELDPAEEEVEFGYKEPKVKEPKSFTTGGSLAPAPASTSPPAEKRFRSLLALYKPDYVMEVARLSMNGATEREIIVHLQVTKKVFNA